MLFRRRGQLRHEIVHHFLEFVSLFGIENLKNPCSAGRAQIVKLVLKALIVKPVIVEDQGDLLGLLAREVQLRPEFLQNCVLYAVFRGPGRHAGNKCNSAAVKVAIAECQVLPE